VIGLFGGAFDPPHNGHVALLAAARAVFGLEDVVVIVAAAPGHKAVELPAETRLELARAAFPGETIVLDEHARTIDTIRAHPEWEGALFLVGADEFAEFLTWKEPDELLRHVRLGVATRPGHPRERLEAVLAALEQPERVLFFDLEPQPVASSGLRAALDRGEDVRASVPPAVWAIVEREGLYGRDASYTESA
jgi:nicotinate-nucleotide adenylyltransferase